jgi:hypothetical protein
MFIGQGYDGAATMSGSKNGVAARILRDYNTAVFVHCHNHKLNLLLNFLYFLIFFYIGRRKFKKVNCFMEYKIIILLFFYFSI